MNNFSSIKGLRHRFLTCYQRGGQEEQHLWVGEYVGEALGDAPGGLLEAQVKPQQGGAGQQLHAEVQHEGSAGGGCRGGRGVEGLGLCRRHQMGLLWAR